MTWLSWMIFLKHYLFIEIDKKKVVNSQNNMIVGVMYHPTGTNTSTFNDQLSTICTRIKTGQKTCHIISDYNINLFKSWKLPADTEIPQFHVLNQIIPVITKLIRLKPRSHLADLTADLSRPGWSGEVLWSRTEVRKERGWVLEGPERSVNLVEVSPTIPDCFELFKMIGSGRGWRAVVDRALGSRVRSLGECEHSQQRTCMIRKEPGRPSQPTTHD